MLTPRASGRVFVVACVLAIAVRASAQAPFTDDPIVPGVTRIKAIHITELRTRVNALRSQNALPPFVFTNPTLNVGATFVRAVHILELRTALDAVFAQLSLSAPAYTDPGLAIGGIVKAAHVSDLRTYVFTVETFTAKLTIGQPAPALTQVIGGEGFPGGATCTLSLGGVALSGSIVTAGGLGRFQQTKTTTAVPAGFPRAVQLACGAAGTFTGTQYADIDTIGLTPAGTLTFQPTTVGGNAVIDGNGFPASCTASLYFLNTTANPPGYVSMGFFVTAANGTFSQLFPFPSSAETSGGFAWKGTAGCANSALGGSNPGGSYPRVVPMAPVGRGVSPQVSPSPLGFGIEATTSSRLLSVLVTNAGTGVLATDSSTGISGPSASDFGLSSGCALLPLGPGSNCAMQVTFHPLSTGAKTATLDVVTIGGPTVHVPLTGTGLVADMRLFGRVTDRNSAQPLPNTSVTTYDNGGSPVTTVMTDADGTWATGVLSAGAYFAKATGQPDRVDQLFRDISCALGCTPTFGTAVTVPSTLYTHVDFGLYRPASVVGTVTADDTSPISGAVVRLYDTTGKFTKEAVTNGSGSYQFTSLVPGDYLAATVNSAFHVDEVFDNISCALGCDIKSLAGVVTMPAAFHAPTVTAGTVSPGVADFSLGRLLFKEDGDINAFTGTAVPGWTLCDPNCASVLISNSVKKLGPNGIKVNGDGYRYRPLAFTYTGELEMYVYMKPAIDSNTNFNIRLGSTMNAPSVVVRMDPTNTWIVSTAAGDTALGAYKLTWTKVRLVLHTASETVDAFIDDVQVATGISAPGLSAGIGIVGALSGRNGVGHDSYFDQLILSRKSP